MKHAGTLDSATRVQEKALHRCLKIKGNQQIAKICAKFLKSAQHEEICEHWRGC